MQLFKRTIDQYDRLRKRGAYLDSYKKEAMFSGGLGEFDDARESAQSLVDEYAACERADYIVRRRL